MVLSIQVHVKVVGRIAAPTLSGTKGTATVFLAENYLIFASAEGEDSERMRGGGGEREGLNADRD